MRWRLLIISLFIIFPFSQSWGQEPDKLYTEALNALNEAKYEEAATLFQKYLTLYPDESKTTAASYNLADALYRQEKFQEAASKYEETANMDPDNELAPESLSKTGDCYSKLNDLINLERVSKKLINLYPQTPHAEFARYNLVGLKASSQIKASLPVAVSQTQTTTPETKTEKPMDMEIQEDLLLKTAKDVFKAKDYKTALDLFISFLNKFPRSNKAAYAQLKIAECYYYLERYKESVAAYKKVLDYSKERLYTEYAQYSMGWCYYRLGDYKNARLSLEKLINDYPDGKYANTAKKELEEIVLRLNEEEAKNLLAKAKGLQEKGEIKAASETLSELINKYSNSSVAQEAKQLSTKLKDLIIASSDKEAKALSEAGEREFNAGSLDKAEDKFKQLVLDYPESSYTPSAQERLKTIRQKRIDQKAKSELEKGQEYLNNKDYLKARLKFEEVIQKFPDSRYKEDAELKLKEAIVYESDIGAYELYKKALTLIKNDNYDQALKTFQQLIDQYPNSNYITLAKAGIKSTQDSIRNQGMQRQFTIAQRYYDLGDYAAAIEAFKEIQMDYPETSYAQRADDIIKELSETEPLKKGAAEEYKTAQEYYKQGQLSKAKKNLSAIIQKYPQSSYAKSAEEILKTIDKRTINESAKALYDAGRRYQEYAEYEKAIAKYEEVLNNFQESYWTVYACYAKAESLYAQGAYSLAKAEWQRVITEFKNPDLSPHALYHIAECYEQLKQFNQAKESYQKLQQEYPNSIYAQGDLADLIIKRMGGLEGK